MRHSVSMCGMAHAFSADLFATVFALQRTERHLVAPWLCLFLNRISDDQAVFLVESTACMDGPPARSEIDVRQVETG